MKTAWLVRPTGEDEWRIVFDEPPGWHGVIVPIAYMELETTNNMPIEPQ